MGFFFFLFLIFFFIYNHTIDLNCIVPGAPLEIVHLEVYI